mmetsp:Transcript_34748/g.110484  ORF Transcript_34748/g.110484 Transcript_34748/m.110484 type:complete len:241 (+) Transcript_34748:86-808(+)
MAPGAKAVRQTRKPGRGPHLLRSLVLGSAFLASWKCGVSFAPSRLTSTPPRRPAPSTLACGLILQSASREGSLVRVQAARKKAGSPISDGDTVYIKVMTGRYIGELDGTSRKEWVKARGTKKDADHALTIEKPGGGEVSSGDTIKLVMPLTMTNGTKIHMDIVGSAVRARHYDPRGEWQKMTIVKQEGGTICDGDTIFIRSVFMNGRDYMDANPLEKAADGEVKCRWPDEGHWQKMTIEK